MLEPRSVLTDLLQQVDRLIERSGYRIERFSTKTKEAEHNSRTLESDVDALTDDVRAAVQHFRSSALSSQQKVALAMHIYRTAVRLAS